MNIKEILLKKAEYPVRLIALGTDIKESSSIVDYEKGDEIGIELIDFSCGLLRVCNKTKSSIFYLYYDKETGVLDGEFIFKSDLNNSV